MLLLLHLSLQDGHLLLDGAQIAHTVVEHLPHFLHFNVLQHKEEGQALSLQSTVDPTWKQLMSWRHMPAQKQFPASWADPACGVPTTHPFLHFLASAVIESLLLL